MKIKIRMMTMMMTMMTGMIVGMMMIAAKTRNMIMKKLKRKT